MQSSFRSRPALSALVVALSSAGWSPSWGQSADTGSSGLLAATERAGGIVTVTGPRPSSLPAYIPTTVESLTAEQIAERINANDAEDVLKYFPSLLVRKRYIGDYNHAILSSRASGTGNSARSAVYADGILLSNYLGNGVGGLSFPPRWGMITADEIERVDVLYGPFSAAYPGNSVGAVVDYITRMPEKFEAHARFTYTRQPFDLYETHGTYGARQTAVSVGDKAGALRWWLHVQRSDSQGQPLTFATRLVSTGTAGGTGVPVNGAVLDKNNANAPWWILGTQTQYHSVQDHARFKASYDVDTHTRATATFGIWRNDSAGNPSSYLRNSAGQAVTSGAISINGSTYAAVSGGDLPLTREDLQHRMLAVSLKRSAGDAFDWELSSSSYSYGQDNNRRNAATNTLPGAASGGAGTVAVGDGTGWTNLAAKGIWRPGGAQGAHRVDFGAQLDSYELRYSTFNIAGNWLVDAPGALASFVGGKTRLSSLYLQDVWTFHPDWKAVVGARSERWEAQNGVTNFTATSAIAHPQRSESHLSPKFALAYSANSEWTLKGSLGKAVRMPTVAELYGATSTTNSQFINDPYLKPERSWTHELSAERDTRAGSLRLTVFGETTRDAIYSQSVVDVAAGNRTISRVQNVGRIDTTGAEVSLFTRDIGGVRNLDAQASVTYADSLIKENAGFVAVAGDTLGKRQPNIPKWRASGTLTWRWAPTWSGTLGGRYSGQQFRTLNNADVNGFTYQGVSSFKLVDVRIRHQWSKLVTLSAGIDNVGGQTYWNFHPYPQRSYLFEVKVDL